jgi:hypothetical protein
MGLFSSGALLDDLYSLTPSSSCPSSTIDRVRSVACGASLGGVVFPIAIVRLIPILGAAWTIRIIGFIQLVVLGAAYPMLSTVMPPTAEPFSHRTLVDRQALRDPAYVAFVAGSSLLMFGLYTPFVSVVPRSTTPSNQGSRA